MGERIGIFGGTFNPPHRAHIALAEFARDALALDRVIFIPARIPPHKRAASDIASDADRLAMLRLAIAGRAGFEISEAELSREGVSFTVDTLREIRAAHPGDELFLVIGADSFVEFPTWREPKEIARLATLAVVPRRGISVEAHGAPFHDRAVFVDAPPIDISSTRIRELIREAKPIRGLVEDSVAEYVNERQLYRKE